LARGKISHEQPEDRERGSLGKSSRGASPEGCPRAELPAGRTPKPTNLSRESSFGGGEERNPFKGRGRELGEKVHRNPEKETECNGRPYCELG